MIKLVISDNEGTTTVVPFARDEISIGRKEGNTIRLTERNISREHCRLARKNGSYVVRDMRSYNGVLINGQRIEGESPIKPGDEIRIGDYTLQLEAEARASEEPGAEPARVSVAPKPATPARLVVLTAPLAGAEFSLPERGELRIGRAPELDVSLDHRSVSREHAKLACDGAQIRIIDAGSVNGVVVNHEKVSEARLAAGDTIELGDIVLRFVAVGEHFVFDPAAAKALVGARRSGLRMPHFIALGAIACALVAGLVLTRSSEKSEPRELTAKPEPNPAVAVVSPQAVAPEKAAPVADPFAGLLDSCRQANEGGRYAEAVAHANAALKLRPNAEDALACQQIARVNDEQEQIFVRAKAALTAGDTESAWKELVSLAPNSAVRQRPEVAGAIEAAADQRLAEAQQLLQRKRADQAVELASSVLAFEALPDSVHAEAQSIIARAPARAGKPPHPEPAAHAATASDAHAKPAQAPHAAAPPHAAPAPDKPLMEVATACLAHGDNACVVRTLSGRAQTAQELGLLIETYRAMGDTAPAYRNMSLYVQRYPTARRADAYRQMLERQGH